MTGSYTTIDEYLTTLDEAPRATLTKIRKAVHAAAPGAVECISYRLPAFRFDGKLLVALGAAANHCAFYPMSAATIQAHAKDLARYETSKGTIRFPVDQALPATLVKKLVKARIRENAERAK